MSISFFSFSLHSPFLPQLFLKELQQWQGQVDETNALADKLLTLYANDDTHKVTQVNNNMVSTWTHISKRYLMCKITTLQLVEAQDRRLNQKATNRLQAHF